MFESVSVDQEHLRVSQSLYQPGWTQGEKPSRQAVGWLPQTVSVMKLKIEISVNVRFLIHKWHTHERASKLCNRLTTSV